MLWYGRQADRRDAELIEPAALKVPLDAEICRGKLQRLLDDLSDRGGVDAFVTSLGKKHELFRSVLAPEQVEAMDRGTLDTLLECVFTVRRRLPAALSRVSHETLLEAVKALLYGRENLAERMRAFVATVPDADRKMKRATWDFAAELLHFRAPEHYPLMTRWVWDPNTVSGALREFLRGNDTLRHIPIDDRPGTFEGARVWFAEQLAALGFYRDVHFVVDLLLAQAYGDYVRAMASGMGILSADFGAKNDPAELLAKLLGIDPARRSGRPRIKPILH